MPKLTQAVREAREQRREAREDALCDKEILRLKLWWDSAAIFEEDGVCEKCGGAASAHWRRPSSGRRWVNPATATAEEKHEAAMANAVEMFDVEDCGVSAAGREKYLDRIRCEVPYVAGGVILRVCTRCQYMWVELPLDIETWITEQDVPVAPDNVRRLPPSTPEPR